MSWDANRLLATLESGRVMRYHAVPTVAQQTVGQHSHGVAVICLHLTGGQVSRELLIAALLHDAAEIVTGDIPFTTKRASPMMKAILGEMETAAHADVVLPMPALSEAEAALLKLADTLEGLLWCRKTEAVGPVRDRWVHALEHALVKFSGLLPPEVIVNAQDLAGIDPFPRL